MLAKPPEDTAQRMQLVLQLGRAISYNDTFLARKVSDVLPEVHTFLTCGDGAVTVINGKMFDEFTTKTVLEHFNSESN